MRFFAVLATAVLAVSAGKLRASSKSRADVARAAHLVDSSVFDCKGKTDGDYEYLQSGCKQFVKCSNHMAYLFDCQPGLLFNVQKDMCDYAANVQCGNPSTTAPPKCKEEVDDKFCKDRKDGQYDHPCDCSKFVSCSNHFAYVMDCPKDLEFNAATNQCDWPGKVECSH